jgi:hypothetical protein
VTPSLRVVPFVDPILAWARAILGPAFQVRAAPLDDAQVACALASASPAPPQP